MDIEPKKFTANDARLLSEKYKEFCLNNYEAKYTQIIHKIQNIANETEERSLLIKGDLHPYITDKLKEVGFELCCTYYGEHNQYRTVQIMW